MWSRVSAPSALLHAVFSDVSALVQCPVNDVSGCFSDPREDKIRVLREKQTEERLRRLEDLKKHALEAQQLREQKEAERRRRMDELRVKETERRSQVYYFDLKFLIVI